MQHSSSDYSHWLQPACFHLHALQRSSQRVRSNPVAAAVEAEAEAVVLLSLDRKLLERFRYRLIRTLSRSESTLLAIDLQLVVTAPEVQRL